jgi:hypothetical protein
MAATFSTPHPQRLGAGEALCCLTYANALPCSLGWRLRTCGRIRWRSTSAADRDLLRAPFRADIGLDAYQLLPLRKASGCRA